MFRSTDIKSKIRGLKEQRREGKIPLEEMVHKTERILDGPA
jgi:hypothetical protein